MSGRKYARGRNAIAECQRSGQKMRYRDLVEDGHVPGLLVHPDWWEPKHPQEIPVEIHDPIALYRPAPEISIEDDYGNPDVNYGATPSAPIIIDTFNRADGDPGATWEDSGLAVIGPTYFVRPVIESNALVPGTGAYPYPLFAVAHTDTIPVDHYAEVTLIDSVPGSYFIGPYVWARAQVGVDAATMTQSIDTGYYAYLAASTAYGFATLSINRWDVDTVNGNGTYYNSQQFTLNNTGIIPDGTVLGIQCVGRNIIGYVNFPDGSQFHTGGANIQPGFFDADPALDFAPFTGMGAHINNQRCGIGCEGYGGADIGFDRFEAGGVNTHTGTLATTLNGGETRIALDDAVKIGPWAEWIGIALDGGGWHMSRLNSGVSSLSEDSVVFSIEFNTAFPTASTATAGNSYYIGGRR